MIITDITFTLNLNTLALVMINNCARENIVRYIQVQK